MALAAGIPLISAAIWGTFAVVDDPSRSGSAPIPVPGVLRVGIEVVFFSAACWALYELDAHALAWVMGIVTVAHYAVSYDRLLWLFSQ